MSVCLSVGLWVTVLLECLANLLIFLKTAIRWPIMNWFWSSRCLNYCINVPDKIWLFSSGATTSMVVKIELNFFLIFFCSIHASWKLLYSLCFSRYISIINNTWFYGHGTTTFAQIFFIQISFVTQSFDLKMTYFRRWLSRQKLLLFKCKLLNKTLK